MPPEITIGPVNLTYAAKSPKTPDQLLEDLLHTYLTETEGGSSQAISPATLKYRLSCIATDPNVSPAVQRAAKQRLGAMPIKPVATKAKNTDKITSEADAYLRLYQKLAAEAGSTDTIESDANAYLIQYQQLLEAHQKLVTKKQGRNGH